MENKEVSYQSLVQRQAPAWEAEALVGEEFKKLSHTSFKGKWVCLFFYPLDFTFVCPTEIVAYNEAQKQFHELNCEIVGCSVDSKFTHLAWAKTPRKEGGIGKLNIPILADITKKIARDFGVLIGDSVALRGTFLINPEGKVVTQTIHDLPVGRNIEETLRALRAAQEVAKTGEVCPANWAPGKKTMKPDPTGSKEYFQSSN